MRHTIPAVIFAGGKSSRMGKDKALLPFGDYPSLAEYQFRRLSTLFPQVYLSAKSAKFDFDVPLIQDLYPESSPLVGIVSLFETLKSEQLFLLPVDAPFVDESIIDALVDADRGEDAVIARSPGGTHPLCGLYRRSVLPVAQERLRQKRHKLGELLEAVNTRYVDFEGEERFMNLNRPEEYEKAKRIIF